MGGGSGGQWEGSGWRGGVRVDVNEIEVFVKIQKKKLFWEGGGGRGGGGGGGGGGSGGSVGGGSGSGWGVRVDVNEELKFL